MRQIMILLLTLLMATTFIFTTGCYVKTEKEVVKERPPAPTPPPLRVEERPVAPAPVDVWTPGHWEWNGNDWVWTPGQWVEPPRANAIWTPSHWEWNGHDWVWIAGHWQQ
jgi:hypothetical protein